MSKLNSESPQTIIYSMCVICRLSAEGERLRITNLKGSSVEQAEHRITATVANPRSAPRIPSFGADSNKDPAEEETHAQLARAENDIDAIRVATLWATTAAWRDAIAHSAPPP